MTYSVNQEIVVRRKNIHHYGKVTKVTPTGRVTVLCGTASYTFNSKGKELGGSKYSSLNLTTGVGFYRQQDARRIKYQAGARELEKICSKLDDYSRCYNMSAESMVESIEEMQKILAAALAAVKN